MIVTNSMWNPYYSTYSPQSGTGLAPQAFLGGLLGSAVGKPLGGLIGGLFGGEGESIGGTIGGLVGSVGGAFLPFSAGPQFSLAGTGLTARSSGDARPILLPKSTLPSPIKTTLQMQTSLVHGGVPRLVGDLAKVVSQATDVNPNIKPELDALTSRAMDFVESGDYQHALVQAYIRYQALEAARLSAATTAGMGNSQPVPVG